MKALLLAALVLVGCKGKDAPDTGTKAPAGSAVADACKGAKQEGPLAWFEDDLPAASACAMSRKVPLVVDLWAPWCHTCLSMQSTVFRDKAMDPMAARFVFASIDTDRETNASAVAKLPLSAWPTFYVLAPEDGSVLARFAGGASVAQFTAFLEAGEAARTASSNGAAKHLLDAERAITAKDLAKAEAELTAALAAAPPTWVRTPDVLVSLISTRKKRGDNAGCFALAQEKLDATGNAASATDFAGYGLACAEALEKDTSKTADIAAYRERATKRIEALLADVKAPLSLDDRSDAMSYWREALTSLGKKDEAAAVGEKQKTLLEEAIAKAPDPVAASTYNYQLADVCVALGRPLDAVPLLEKSANALPKEYDPAARLGWVYLEAGKLDEATTWTDKALALVYGPRKARVLTQRANIAKKKGDTAAEKKYRADIVALWESLPAEQKNADALAKAKAELAALDAPAPAAATN
jgi:thioredoxin-like negative regulator of GroEL